MNPSAEFIQMLQSGIAPIALISGVGLILLSLTNRLARTIDRSRSLAAELRKGEDAFKEMKILELRTLYKRSRILRVSIGAISFSILTTSLIIAVLLIMSTTGVNLKFLGSILLVLSISGIIVSAVTLFYDIILTLKALDYEVKDYLK
jgi:hypothetical protein